MSRQYSDYSAPSLDGYDAQLNSLFEYAPAPPINTQIEMDPRYISDCFKVSNNKYPDCPAIMDDGRAFTDYRSSCYINDIIRVKNGITNSYDYRQFLINNGNELINAIRLYNIQKSACRSCDAQPIDCQNIHFYVLILYHFNNSSHHIEIVLRFFAANLEKFKNCSIYDYCTHFNSGGCLYSKQIIF